MENSNFDLIINGLPIFCESVTPVAKRCGVTSLEALCLIILAEYPDSLSFYFAMLEDSLKSLTQKGCISADGEKLILTSKGAIIEKSLNAVKEKF